MKFTEADRIEQAFDKSIHLFKDGKLFAKLTRNEAKVNLEGCTAWNIFLDEEFFAKN